MNQSNKTSNLIKGFFLLTVFLSTFYSASATDYYCDFEVNGIFYQFITGKPDEVAVSYDNYETGKYGGNYTNYSGNITIPSTVTYNSVTYKVTAVTSHAFSECSSLISVNLPNSITSIGNAAFADCSSLLRIEFPNNLEIIGQSAFQGCVSLSSITVPNSVYSIGAKAFYETAWYNNQPNGLIYAGRVAYSYKGGVPNGTHIIIKEGTVQIASCAFQGNLGLTSVTLPNSVKSIGSYAFDGCGGLTSINIPNSMTSIESYAFTRCNGLQKVIVSDIAAWCGISFGDNPLSYAHHLYSDEETEITEIDIPEGVLSIGSDAFRGSFALTSVNFPNSLTSIGNNAFYNCSSLKSITLPKSLINIGNSAFFRCSGLTSISIETENPIYDSRNNCNAIIESATNTLLVGCMNTIIPNSVTSIGYNAFYYCSNLTSINIPSGVTSIGDYAFSYCDGLTDVYCYAEEFPSTSSYSFDITAISNMTLHVPEKVLETYKTTSPWSGFGTIVPIGPYFADAKVEAICVANWDTDGDGYLSYEEAGVVTTLGDVLKGNTSITSFDELQYFTGLTRINNSAFYGCSNLISISIPKNVMSIGESAFSGCINLKDVYCHAEDVPSTEGYVFYGLNTFTATLHVPAASTTAYWETSPWSEFGRVMAIDTQKIFYAISDESTSLNVVNIEKESKAKFTHDFNGEWETLCLPFAIDYDAIKADFDLAEIDGVVQNDDNNDGIVDFTVLSIIGFREQKTEPNMPYLIRAKQAGEQTIHFEDMTVYPTEEATFECSSFSTKYEFTGSYNALDTSDLTNRYTVQNGELVKGANSLAPCRWYMTATAKRGSLNLPNKIRIMPVEDVITGVETLSDSSLKDEDIIYNFAGQRLSKSAKGINIVGGRKVLVK